MRKNVTLDSLVNRRDRIAVVGLGYVGLPLAVHLGDHFSVLGFDIQKKRVAELKKGTTGPVRCRNRSCRKRPLSSHPTPPISRPAV